MMNRGFTVHISALTLDLVRNLFLPNLCFFSSQYVTLFFHFPSYSADPLLMFRLIVFGLQTPIFHHTICLLASSVSSSFSQFLLYCHV
jgi:hypothetical protein